MLPGRGRGSKTGLRVSDRASTHTCGGVLKVRLVYGRQQQMLWTTTLDYIRHQAGLVQTFKLEGSSCRKARISTVGRHPSFSFCTSPSLSLSPSCHPYPYSSNYGQGCVFTCSMRTNQSTRWLCSAAHDWPTCQTRCF